MIAAFFLEQADIPRSINQLLSNIHLWDNQLFIGLNYNSFDGLLYIYEHLSYTLKQISIKLR